MAEITAHAGIREVLVNTRHVAVLGAHDDRGRAAYYVPAYLHSMGYSIHPVNPMKVGLTLFDEPVRDRLDHLDVSIDLVDVFRRSEVLGDHLDEILAMDPLPKTVWFQQGVRNDVVAAALIAAGIDVVQDRCTMADHRALRLSKLGKP